MPGIATQFVVLDRLIDRLRASGDARQDKIATVLTDNLPYAYLGAIGPALADFLPGDPVDPAMPSTGTSPYSSIWVQVLEIAGGDGTNADPGAVKVIGGFRRFLDKIVPIAEAEDLAALSDMNDSGEVDSIVALAASLGAIVNGLLPRVAAIGSGISAGMRPAVNVPAGSSVPPPAVWTAREFLHWKRPGRFATALLRRAQDVGDPRFLAYAYGYVSSFAASVVGSPFVNSTIGASYRQQWWRYRWVNNYVDAWVHGAYGAGATMSGDTPTPPYPQWTALCDAKLHERISLGAIDPVDIMARLRAGTPFPAFLPNDVAGWWMDAWKAAYGDPPLGSRFRANALNGAYVMTWMALWFETSGEVVGCNPAPPMQPPGNCGDVPSWVDPNVPGDTGGPQAPPAPGVESHPDVGEIVSGIILALIGDAGFVAQAWVAGGAAIVVGIGDIIHGASEIDWAKLRCDLYWYRMYLYNGLKALHDLLTLGAVGHPYPAELALDTTTITLLGIPYTFDSGRRLVRSRVLLPAELARANHLESEGQFPSKPWSGSLGDWVKMPTPADPGIEQPETTAYETRAYPTFFIDDDAANPLSAQTDVKTGAPWPPGVRERPGSELPVQFATAVSNAVDLLLHPDEDLPDWNLDADRGLAWLTWQFKSDTMTDPVEAVPEA